MKKADKEFSNNLGAQVTNRITSKTWKLINYKGRSHLDNEYNNNNIGKRI